MATIFNTYTPTGVFGTSHSYTITALTAGRSVIFCVQFDSSIAISNVRIGGVLATQDKVYNDLNIANNVYWYSLHNVAAGGTTVTFTTAANTTPSRPVIQEVSAVPTVTAGATNNGGSATNMNATVTVPQAASLVVAQFSGTALSYVSPSGYTTVGTSGSSFNFNGYNPSVAAGSHNPSWSASAANNWYMGLVAYSPAAAGGQPPSTDWDWDGEQAWGDDTADLIAETTRYANVPAIQYVDRYFNEESEYEDPILDILESGAGPVQPNAPPLGRLLDDPWAWDIEPEDSYEETTDAEPVDAGDMPPTVEPVDDDFEDAWADLLDSEPVDAVEADPPDELLDWDWDAEHATDDYQPLDDELSPDQPALVQDEVWDYDDDNELDERVDVDAYPLIDQPAIAPDDGWPWDEPEHDDLPDDQVQGTAAPVDVVLDADSPWDEEADDSWWESFDARPVRNSNLRFQDGVDDDDLLDDSWWEALDAAIGENQPALPVDDGWTWDEAPDDDQPDDAQPVAAAVVVQADQPPSDEPWPDDADEPADFDSAPVPTVIVVVAEQPPGDGWDFDEPEDEPLDAGAPVGPDEPAPPVADAFLDDDTDDDWDGSSAPVADAAVLVAEPVLEADWQWDDTEPEPDPSEPPVGADEPPLPPAIDWPWDDEDTDEDPAAQPVGADQPGVPADAWDWAEPEVEDDEWWANPTWLDFIALAGLQPADEWDFDGDNQPDDDQWPLPAPDEQTEVSCPVQLAEALAQIAVLQALVADLQAQLAARPPSTGTSGGGDEWPHEGDRIRERQRRDEQARIANNNAILMAVAAAMLHPKDDPP